MGEVLTNNLPLAYNHASYYLGSLSNMEKQRGIYARYSSGRDRDHTHRTPKLPDIPTFHSTPLHTLTPEMQKAAVGGLI